MSRVASPLIREHTHNSIPKLTLKPLHFRFIFSRGEKGKATRKKQRENERKAKKASSSLVAFLKLVRTPTYLDTSSPFLLLRPYQQDQESQTFSLSIFLFFLLHCFNVR